MRGIVWVEGGAAEAIAEPVVVGHAVEAVAAGVDDDRSVDVGVVHSHDSGIPLDGQPLETVVAEVAHRILPYTLGNTHPRFWGWVHGSGTPGGIVAQMLQGAMLAAEEANARGGYKGMPFKIMPHNDVGLWGAAANEVVKMSDEGAWAILGTIDDINSHVAIRVALKLEIPVINCGDPDLSM